MKKHFNIKVFGRAQGVFFRQKAKLKAQELKISGFVRNEPNGSVYLEAEGGEEALRELIDWCKKGPDLARVDKVEVGEDQTKNYSEFRIVW